MINFRKLLTVPLGAQSWLRTQAHKLYAAQDYPILLNFPENAYRKGIGNARGSLSDVMSVGLIKLLIILSGSDAKRRAVELNC